TITTNTHGGCFTRRIGHGSGVITRKFDKRGKTDTKHAGVISLAILALLCPPARVISQFKRTVESRLVIAAIVLKSGHSCIRKGPRRNEIAAAHLRRIEVQFMGDAIHGALQDIGSFGSPSSS